MNVNTPDFKFLAQRTTSGRLLKLLKSSGWGTVGRRKNVYERLQSESDPGFRRTSVIVPLDRDASDYGLLMKAALETANRLTPGVWDRRIAPLLGLSSADTFSFRKQTSAPDGLISWTDGRDLIVSASRTLAAGAKSYIEPSRHFSDRFGQFANRYLDHVLMGQSRTGSYTVTAVAPTEAVVPITDTTKPALDLEGVTVARARNVTASVVGALEAAVEAVDHFKASGSMSGFDEQVDRGVSYELVTALRDISSGADESDITIELAPVDDLCLHDEPATQMQTRRFEFSGGDAGVLDRASNQLCVKIEAEPVVVEGRVHLLAKKEISGPGVVGVDDGHHRYRVRLGSDEEYHEAVMAHNQNRNITVRGELSREGTLRWLYGAELRTRPTTPPEPTTTEPDTTEPLAGQQQLPG